MGLPTRRMLRNITWIVGLGAIGAASAILGVLAVVYAMVYFGDDSHLKKSTIMARINEETTIYMLDDTTQIGSIFDETHRSYVSIDEIPAHMINAIVAAEDKNFYNHHGIDVGAIFAAGVEYATGQSGKMRGASTLTQQTVRNIMGWWEVTLSRKFREWIAALQLERLYSKRQILEFYLNQFYVSGNGNGIGIAARYYFNKDVSELDLVESAFIAGSVKGPSAYDPFIKFTKEHRERAIKRAFQRKNYVLGRMLEQGWISKEQFKESYEAPVRFNRGRFRSEEVTLVQLIRSQLDKPEILEALGIDDARELSRAGLKIYTTIDPEMQASAQLAMRRNLSRLETILKGFKAESADRFRRERHLVVNDFYYGQVAEIAGTPGKPEIKVNFGLPNGVIPFESLMRYAKWLDLPFGRGWQSELDKMIKQIKVGDMLFVEIKEYNADTHEAVLELQKRPKVNGGMIAIDKGEVRSVVSGFDTKGFNRAMTAKRQPGSVFKSVAYFAGLQLGWSMLDRLDNERQIFPFQGRFYYPNPDHDSPYRETSVLWAGVTSENLASVSLAARLLDKLNFGQFRQLMGSMDLLPRSGESPRDFHFRVARETGVQIDNDGIKEFQLQNAANDLQLDVQYTATPEFLSNLRKMWWGRGYQSEIQSLLLSSDKDSSAARKTQRFKLVANNFHRLQALEAQLGNDWRQIEKFVADKGYEAALSDSSLQTALQKFRVLPGLSKPGLGYTAVLDNERPTKSYAGKGEIDRQLAPIGRALTPMDIQSIWGGSAFFGSANITLDDVQLDGWFSRANFIALRNYVEQRYNEVIERQEDYDLHKYWQHHDFRIALGLNYLVHLTKAMGVTSKVEPVLSFPLGTNDVTMAEVALIYQTFINGKTYKYYKEGAPNQLNFIRRIEDRYGNALYEPQRREHQLVLPEFALQMREMLRRVVTHGTGRRARGELYMTLGGADAAAKAKAREMRIGIPSFGKTGTTNDYTNSNFAGFVPYPITKGEPLDPDNSYVIAAYVGYDLQKPMRNGMLRITGAQGALPAWIGLAKEVIDKKKYTDFVDALDLNVIAQKEWALKNDTLGVPLRVDMPRGVILDKRQGDGGDAFSSTNIDTEGESSFDEYRANTVQGSIRMPVEPGSNTPLRRFSPFRLADDDKKLLSPASSKIDTASKAGRDWLEAPARETRVVDEPGHRQPQPAEGAKAASSASSEVASQSNATAAAGNAAGSASPAAETPASPNDASKDDDDEGNYDDLFKDVRRPPSSRGKQNDDEPGYVEEEIW